MINNKARIGNFTSSGIVALTKKAKDGVSMGVPCLTYIDEKKMERRLGRSLDSETIAKPLTWGKLLEPHVFGMLGLDYTLVSLETIVHPAFPFWSGSPDGHKKDTVYDIKCPVTLKSFCKLVDPLYNGITGMEAMNVIRKTHDSGETYYWQLVSNAVLTKSKFAELIVYMPYQAELEDVRLMAQNVPAEYLSRHYWIAMGQDDELPYLLDGGYYKNINVINFEIPGEDKEFLTDCVVAAAVRLVEQPTDTSLKQADPVKQSAATPAVNLADLLIKI